jgi:hypothetical protein
MARPDDKEPRPCATHKTHWLLYAPHHND